jgi:hypothetical protein
MIEETLCPICKSKMKPAKSQHGVYWRCSRWGCQGTRDVDGNSKEDRDRDRSSEADAKES